MRLGFWNRLAIAGLGVSLLLFPSVYWYVLSSDYGRGQSAMLDLCMRPAEAALANHEYARYNALRDTCWGEYYPKHDPQWPNWGDWWEGFGATAFGYAFFYGIVWALVLIIKWIWRGRRADGPHANA